MYEYATRLFKMQYRYSTIGHNITPILYSTIINLSIETTPLLR